jgi:MarR family 2-MHQ and catechol resistance regulon transcriptional repressor
MYSIDSLTQCIVDVLGAIYRNLIRDEEDAVSINTNSQSAVLSVLLRNGPTKMSEIGRILKVSKPNITFLVDKLEEQGLIRREDDKEDRRVKNISLTAQGRAAIEEQKARLHAKIKTRLAVLTEQDLEDFEASLRIAAEVLRKFH